MNAPPPPGPGGDLDEGGFDDGGGGGMPPPGGPGGGPPMDYGDMGGAPADGGGLFGPIMLCRKALSISAMFAVMVLEGAVGIQDVQMSSLSDVLKSKNSFREREELVQTGMVLAAKVAKKAKGPDISCGYFAGFDVPAVTAGQARSLTFHFANCIFLCALLWLERPGPLEASQAAGASRFSLPPVGNVGLVTFSLLQMVGFIFMLASQSLHARKWLGSSVANHYIGTISYIAAYVLIITGVLGLLFSLMFMSKLKMASSAAGGGGGAAGMGMPPPMDDMY